MVDITDHNRRAWNRQAEEGESRWVQPVDAETISRARSGVWSLILTPTKDVPRDWFGDVAGKRVLCLASGGGQQAPILAAAGADVTSFDLSDAQLALDRQVADREGLQLRTVQGNMADLSCFPGGNFDLIFHPISNVFAPDLAPIWREACRVLVPGGRLLSGFMNPAFFMFDHEAIEEGEPMQPVFRLPYADPEHLPADRLAAWIESGQALEFGHSLEDQIGGQIKAGFVIAGFYEDWWTNEATPLNDYMPTSMATLAMKPVS